MDPLAPSTSAMKRCHYEPVELIAALRARPCLWDKTHPQYRLRAAKERAWREVSAALQPRYHTLNAAERHELEVIIMRKWYNIRDAYKKSLAAAARPYVYSALLSFLDAQLGRGTGSQNETKDEDLEDQIEADVEGEGEEWLNVLELEEESPPLKRFAQHGAERGRGGEGGGQGGGGGGGLLPVLVGLMEKEEDEDRAFFRSITPAVKSLTDEAKFLFRIEVMKLLNNLRKQKGRGVKTEALSEATDSD